MPAAAGIPLLFWLPPFLLLIPARMFLAVVSASVLAGPAGESPSFDITPPTIRFLRLLSCLASCGLYFPVLADLLRPLLLINEGHSSSS